MLNKTSIIDRVQDQFPEFYTEYGETFIEFMKVYFKWLEENKYTGPTRDLPASLNIDTTEDAFLEFFKKEYMAELPSNIIGNQRYLQKHILDLYRSKDSDESFRLLFRLLYNQEIDIYYPGYDVFKTSHAKWVARRYLELSLATSSPNLEGKQIIGEISGAKAVVESYDVITYNGKKNYILWISNIEGNFVVGETVYDTKDNISTCPKILGSPTELTVTDSLPGFMLGDTLITDTDNLLKFSVKQLNDVDLNGVLEPVLEKVGNGYREGNIDISYVKRDANNVGTDFILGYDLRSTGVYKWMCSEPLAPYAATALNSSNYGMPPAGSETLATNIQLGLGFTLDELQDLYVVYTNAAGYGYDSAVDIIAEDTEVAELNLYAEDGETYLGNNAIIVGYASFGKNRALSLKVLNSSFGYHNNQQIDLVSEDDTKTVIGEMVIGAVGIAEGYWSTDDSFVSSNKKLIDSDYWQDFSYDIKINKSFDKYFSILKKTVHPAGWKPFGNIRIIAESNTGASVNTIIEET